MPNKSKEKGDRAERQAMEQLSQIPGVRVERVGLSRQAGLNGEKTQGDLISDFAGIKMSWEVKSRAENAGYSQVLKWLENRDALALKVEGSVRPVVVMGWDMFEELVRKLIDATGHIQTEMESVESRADQCLHRQYLRYYSS